MRSDAATRLRAEIRAEMARQNLTNAALAAGTGIHPQTVGNILTGKSPLTLDYGYEVAEFLGVSLDVLMNRAREQAA